MKKVAITGGIGSGKSYVCHLLEKRGISVYSCDDAAKRLINTSSEIRTLLTKLVGESVYSEEGTVNKAVLASFILKGDKNKEYVNNIVHPIVANDFTSSGMSWMECALLFSSGFDCLVDYVVCITSPREIRRQRIVERDKISESKADEWINIQMSQEEMSELSDFIISNDGKTELEPQIDRLLGELDKTNSL